MDEYKNLINAFYGTKNYHNPSKGEKALLSSNKKTIKKMTGHCYVDTDSLYQSKLRGEKKWK